MKKVYQFALHLVGFLSFFAGTAMISAQVPQLINYQGRVAVGNVNFDGNGQFRFSLVNAAGTVTYWSSSPDNSPADGVPDAAVSLTVTKGLYSVLLGDSTIPNMTAIPNGVFSNTDVRLRVWFNDGTHGSQLLSPDQRIAAVGYAMMAGNVPDGSITSSKIASGAVNADQIAPGSIGPSQLASGAAAANLNAIGQSGVAAGGVILSATENPTLQAAGYVRIGAFTAADGWLERNTTPAGAPTIRKGHSAVWTGSEMIIWGGLSGSNLNEGASYNPVTNHWKTLSTTNAPTARHNHTAVWTGTYMIVWGGQTSVTTTDTGAYYEPVSDIWLLISTVGAPTARTGHTALWTNNGMIIYGGSSFNPGPVYPTDTKRYIPVFNSWFALPTTGAPAARTEHTAVWTGSEMIVWGGRNASGPLGDGARVDPFGSSWTPLPTVAAPVARSLHSAVWTGTEMIVWGGQTAANTYLGDGARFNLESGLWTPMPLAAARSKQTAVWTGTEMLLSGGMGNVGALNLIGRYSPASNTWGSPLAINPPAARFDHTAIWTGSRMIVWGGSNGTTALRSGGQYDPLTNAWTDTALDSQPSSRSGASAIWTGSELIYWGGSSYGYTIDSGGRFDPALNNWRNITLAGAPAGRSGHTALWTGTEMLIWGGESFSGNGGTLLTNGARYNPVADSWSAISTSGAPAAKLGSSSVWSGTEMIVWGGQYLGNYVNTGGRYNPASNSWSSTTTTGAPAAREAHSAVWVGTGMIVYGGITGDPVKINGIPTTLPPDAYRYNPSNNTWVALANAPGNSDHHSAIWTGTDMLTFGGGTSPNYRSGGFRYTAATNQWSALPTSGLATRAGHIASWTGTEMIIWGGYNSSLLADGARFNPASNSWTTMSNINSPPARPLGTGTYSGAWCGTEFFALGGGNGVADGLWSYSPGKSFLLYQRP